MKTRISCCLLIFVLLLFIGSGCQNASLEQPLIGITSVYHPGTGKQSASVSVDYVYVQAVLESGGTPVILPVNEDEASIQDYLNVLDGLVLVGGLDVPPSAYGETPQETVKVMPGQRFSFEKQLIARWLDTHKPILGVCLGMQMTNVVSGGSLIQDIPTEVGKKVIHRGNHVYHKVHIVPGSRLYHILGAEEAMVYSNHHQAVKKLGNNLRVVARSDDGVIEALERIKGGFGLFVQWHPESMTNEKHRKAVYGAFIQACRRYVRESSCGVGCKP